MWRCWMKHPDASTTYSKVLKPEWLVALVEDGAANAAGLKVGEVVLEFDGQEINSVQDLVSAVRGSRSGE